MNWSVGGQRSQRKVGVGINKINSNNNNLNKNGQKEDMIKYAILFNVWGTVPPFYFIFVRILGFLMKANTSFCYVHKKFKSSTRLIEHSMGKKQKQANSSHYSPPKILCFSLFSLSLSLSLPPTPPHFKSAPDNSIMHGVGSHSFIYLLPSITFSINYMLLCYNIICFSYFLTTT